MFRFVGTDGQPIKAKAVSDRVIRLAKLAGVKLTYHTLRKGFGCRYAGKVPAQVLQRLMRHSSIRTTMAYYANVDDAVMEAIPGSQRNSFTGSSGFLVGNFSQFWQHTGEDFESEVLLITETVGAPLKYADLVVDALDETERHLVLLVAVGLDAIPVVFDHRGELLERRQPLPAEGVPPLLEETPRPPGRLVVPQLVERFLEQVGLVQAFVGLEQQLERLTPVGLEIPPMGQERVTLPFDQASVFAN